MNNFRKNPTKGGKPLNINNPKIKKKVIKELMGVEILLQV